MPLRSAPKVDHRLGHQAGAEFAVGSQAQPVAADAEVLAYGSDETMVP